MEFEHFLSRLDAFKAAQTDGNAAHDEILPIRAKEREAAFRNDPDPKVSAVAATIFPKNNEAHILLIERQAYDGVHSAQVGFPGGKVEQEDASLHETALREMEEEVGIDRNVPLFVRELTHLYIPPSRFLVHPFVYCLMELPPLEKDPREVKEIIHMPLAHLLDANSIVEGKITMSHGVAIKTPYFEFEGFKIWGATAMMLSEMKRLLMSSL